LVFVTFMLAILARAGLAIGVVCDTFKTAGRLGSFNSGKLSRGVDQRVLYGWAAHW
jgi:hypothetical protein